MEGVAAPPPYLIGQRKEWIVSDQPETAGFAIYVRTSITNREREELRKKIDYIEQTYSAEFFAKPPEERDLDQSPRVLQRKLLAPYVYGWNARAQDEHGEWKPVPAPAEAGYEAFDCILEPEMSFILDIVAGGYYSLGKAASLRKLSEAIGATSSESQPEEGQRQPERTKPRRGSRKS